MAEVELTDELIAVAMAKADARVGVGSDRCDAFPDRLEDVRHEPGSRGAGPRRGGTIMKRIAWQRSILGVKILLLVVLALLGWSGHGQLGVVVYFIGLALLAIWWAVSAPRYRGEVAAERLEGEAFPGEPVVREGVIYRHVVSDDAE